MRKNLFPVSIVLLSIIFLLGMGFFSVNENIVAAQIPTGSIPTITGSPVLAWVTVLDNEQGFANLRSGPGTLGYDIVGILVVGQSAPALARTIIGDWIQISYPGIPGGVAWIWKDLVILEGNIPILEPPPTITPRTTPTIDPTMAAQFLVEIPATRLPTFTEPAPISMPTFVSVTSQLGGGRLPLGLIIISITVIGLFGLAISYLRGR